MLKCCHINQILKILLVLLVNESLCYSQLRDDTNIHVVVSHFSAQSKRIKHYNEIETAIAANLLNPSITTLHVLYEVVKDDGCDELLLRILDFVNEFWPDESIDSSHVASKFGCTPIRTGRATLHEFLIEYPHQLFSNNNGTKTIVVAINGDIVLDTSIRRLSSLQHGHVAALTVNTGPEMTNCCFDSFQSVVTSEKVNKNAQARARMNEEEVPADLVLPCTPEYGSTCNHMLPDSDQTSHVRDLRQFYKLTRAASNDPAICTNDQWSTSGFQFCGSPRENMVVSWDGYAYVHPLPDVLINNNNPWYIGVPFTGEISSMDPNLKAAYVPEGLMYMNRNGVEARTGCSMQSAGLILHNPCRYIRVAHWHCDPKTHTGKNRSDKADIMKTINQYVRDQAPLFGEPIEDFSTCSTFNIATSCINHEENDCGGINIDPRRIH